MSGPTSGERCWSAGAHTSALLGDLVGAVLLGFFVDRVLSHGHGPNPSDFLLLLLWAPVVPLAVRLTMGGRSAFVRDQTTEALNLSLSSLLVAGLCATVLAYAWVGGLMFAQWFVYVVLVRSCAVVRAARGSTYRFPVCLRLLRGSPRSASPAREGAEVLAEVGPRDCSRAMWVHLGPLICALVAGVPLNALGLVVVAPLAWLVPFFVRRTWGSRPGFVRDQATESLNFEITSALGVVLAAALVTVMAALSLPLVMVYAAGVVVWVWGLVYVLLRVQASVCSRRGEAYRYPVCVRLVAAGAVPRRTAETAGAAEVVRLNTSLTGWERTWASAAHLGPLLLLVAVAGVSLAGQSGWPMLLVVLLWLVPWGIWQTVGRRSPFVRAHAIDSMNLQFTTTLVVGAGFPFTMMVLYPQLWMAFWVVARSIAAVRAGRGHPFRYPLTIAFVRSARVRPTSPSEDVATSVPDSLRP